MSNIINNSHNDTINQITIDCLLNREMYDKCINKSEIKKENIKELKFYRKRIYDLVKRLLTSKEERNNLNPDVNYAFNNFIKTTINYFKILDKQDILQKDYDDLNISNDEDNTQCNDDEVFNNTIPDDENNNYNYNKFLMKKINIPQEKNKMTNLDQFVIRKESKEIQETIIYPQKRVFNLKDESLKDKGIIKKDDNKKKNINNKYDTKKKIQKENDKEHK